MNKKQLIAILAIIVVGILFGSYVMLKGSDSPEKASPSTQAEGGHGHGKGHADKEHHGGKSGEKHDDAKEHGDSEHHEQAATKGSHGGQLYTEGDFGLEIVLAEAQGEARFQVFLSNQGKPLPPNAAKVSITLNRPDGSKEEIAMVPDKDALRSAVPIEEPHVFDATIAAQRANDSFLFSYAKEEGKIEMTEAQAKAGGVTIQTSGAAKIRSGMQLPGEIRFNEDRTAHVVPRLTGIVESVPVSLGQAVKKGAVLAVITSTSLSEQRSELLAAQKRLEFARATYAREKKLWEEKISAQQDYQQAQQQLREAEISVQNAQQKLNAIGAGKTTGGALNRFEVRAPFDGVIVEKHITLGETVKEDASIFTLSDLSTVWAEIVVPAKDLDRVRVGASAMVKATSAESKAAGKVSYVGSLIGEQTRSAKARVVLPNPNMAWRPGLYVNVELTAEEADVPVAVLTNAIQTVNEKPVVFMQIADGFVAQPVTIGRNDGKQTEIVKGLKPGVPYAAAGSFVIKAELGKGSAEHSH
ncbi:efflux RND transporter periplasmic adaptor subunit [Noviherbaspirillum galbum]|uniref:Efflux RND transporter periplasmic adaptor subunit n=1 Tax=Noviherbaspirillum galbum TaxID=2709383 RepID=A0A6B3SRB7_9BURK|nr:efflux RND transporter periplasmic adaptor subunit [Noviherbaspirillum galbum]NEX63317.1 efflux RND transporter periplasmic adaptor subunit [Noviherbaspirillum galbum]